MRELFSVCFVIVLVALALCGFFAQQSKKEIGKPVSYMLFSLLFPVAGNLILTVSQNELLSSIGCYVYFIGMDLMAFTLIEFAESYCDFTLKHKWQNVIIYALLLADVVQLLLNPFFGHAFTLEQVIVDNSIYYRVDPLLGQFYHRIAVYIIFILTLFTFFIKSIRVPRIYAEKYYVILITMILAGAWQSYYIFSRTPIDRSMIGFGLTGVLLFYFTIIYRPLKLLDRMLANIAAKMTDSLFFFDANNRCIWANGRATRLFSIDLDNLDQVPDLLNGLFEDFSRPDPEWETKQVIGYGSNAKYYTLSKKNVTDENGRKVGSYFSILDNTEDELRMKREIYNATHDQLTGLYTKEYLWETIRKTISQKSSTPYWIAYLDIKDFKIVNDIFGNEMGDRVLKKVAEWLHKHSHDNWVYGRISGDSFGVCFQSENPDTKAIESKLSKFVVSNGSIEHKILIHVGLYKVIEPDIGISIMFDRAHLAQTTIKGEYNKHIAFYDDKMRDQVLWNQKISTELERAIAQKELCPYLQPIVDRNGDIIGAEALVRWIHPVEGFLPPIRFIPIFERNGMIAEVDKFIWRSACEILASWKDEKSKMFISVNISPKDFYFMDVYAVITELVEKYGIEPVRLRIEITETVMMTDSESRMAILKKFREAGFVVEMDDFGSGYSSLNQLKDMPLDVLKIDMKFLSKSQDNVRAETILRNILRLSSDLGLYSLTEGVETEEQYKMLSNMGCNLFQGYYFAKPLSVQDFEKLCLDRKNQTSNP